MSDRTLWSDKQSKWKPRNFQAVRVTFPAKGLHCPPPEPTLNVFEQQRREAEERRRKAEESERMLNEHRNEQLRLQKEYRERQREKRKRREPNLTWLARHMRQSAKLKGIAPPTNAQINEAKKAYREGKLII